MSKGCHPHFSMCSSYSALCRWEPPCWLINRLMSELWRQAASLRSTFTPLRTFTDRWAWTIARAPPATQDSTGTPTSAASHTHYCNHNPCLWSKDQHETDQHGLPAHCWVHLDIAPIVVTYWEIFFVCVAFFVDICQRFKYIVSTLQKHPTRNKK